MLSQMHMTIPNRRNQDILLYYLALRDYLACVLLAILGAVVAILAVGNGRPNPHLDVACEEAPGYLEVCKVNALHQLPNQSRETSVTAA